MKLLTIMALLLLASCGGGSTSPGTSPHGEEFEKPVCETGHEWSEEDKLCLPVVTPVTPVCETGKEWNEVTQTCATIVTTPPPATPQTQVDSALQSIVNEYVSRSGNGLPSALTNISLTDEYDTSDIIGGCLIFTNGNTEIRIKRSYWNGQTTNRKKSLMFHELGHCIENLGHTGGAGNGACTTQTKDNTAKVMDACTEKYNNAYALWYRSDWDEVLYEGPLLSNIPAWAFYFDLTGMTNDGYYVLYNSYTMTDMFARFFGE